MNSDIAQSTAPRDSYQFLWILASFPIACFTCALVTDAAYSRTANIMWADFSSWLLATGMAGGALAALVGVVSWIAGHRRQAVGRAWVIMVGGLLTLLIALLNNFVHSRDAWTSVVPTGLALSAVTVLVVLATAWLASGTGHRRTAAIIQSGVRS